MANNEGVEVSPAWPHTHTLEVIEDKVFLKFETGLAAIQNVTISGMLQWQRQKATPEFYTIESVPTGDVFAGAAIVA
jgi:hypothetical protein